MTIQFIYLNPIIHDLSKKKRERGEELSYVLLGCKEQGLYIIVWCWNLQSGFLNLKMFQQLKIH